MPRRHSRTASKRRQLAKSIRRRAPALTIVLISGWRPFFCWFGSHSLRQRVKQPYYRGLGVRLMAAPTLCLSLLLNAPMRNARALIECCKENGTCRLMKMIISRPPTLTTSCLFAEEAAQKQTEKYAHTRKKSRGTQRKRVGRFVGVPFD